MLELREHQQAVVDKLREGFEAGHRAQLLYAPTGFGKTEVAMSIMQATSANFKRAAMVMDRVVLVDQTSRRLTKYGIPHGVMQAQHWRFRPAERIQVCSAQTLEKRAEFPDTELLIIDECHVQRRGVLEYIKGHPSIRVIGLTATPFTKGLGDTYTNVVGATSTGSLIEKGWLTPLKVFIAHEIDMSGAKKVAGEWSQDVAGERGMQITGDIVAEWVKKTHEIFNKPVKTVVFCCNVAHGRDLEKGFKAAGHNFVSISYKEEDDFKREAIEEFSKPDSTIQGLIATDILTRGFDVTDVMIGVSARPFSKSFSSHVQQMGRVMRPHPGKEFAVWLDHSGNYLRFRDDWDMLFTEGVTDLKDGGEKAKKEPTEKAKKDSKCPRCQSLWIRGALSCSECGYIRPNLSMVASVPGEMRELHGANQKLAIANQDFFREVLWYARDRGYKEGWAAHKYKEKFGTFPPRQWGGLESRAPSRETMSWIRSRVIAYAKAAARA